MRPLRFTARIRPGGAIRIPPAVIKRLGLKVGSKIDVRLIGGRVEVTRVATAVEQRIKRLRERSIARPNLVRLLSSIPNVGEAADFVRD